jgi:hypothetical protein
MSLFRNILPRKINVNLAFDAAYGPFGGAGRQAPAASLVRTLPGDTSIR